MSWLFSRALVEAYLPPKSAGTEPCAQLNVMPTPHKFWRNDKMMEFSKLSQFGLTCKLLTEDLGKELLTLYLAGFRAKTLAHQEKELEFMVSEVDCGQKWHASFAKWSQDSLSWKTHQCSLLGGFVEFSETWPKWGLMQDGECWELPDLGLTMSATESGSLLPTPTAHNSKEGAYPAEYTRNTPTLATWVGGKIHPNFTEWMMGWPLDWTDLKPLEMGKFQSWRQQHSIYCQDN